MSKWKRKKYEETSGLSKDSAEDFSPLGLCLLEHFASGMSATGLASNVACLSFLQPYVATFFGSEGPSIQAIALAASKSGANSSDIESLAALGNFGRSSEHIAGQMVSKYCQSPLIQLPEPYFAEIPVAVKTCDDWTMAMKQVACFLPHEWLSWLEGQEQAAGFQELKAFWKKHSREDPKLKGNPILVDPFQHLSYS